MNESEAHPAHSAAGTCRCMNTATSTTTNLHLWPLQLHNRDINHQMYGNWVNLNDRLDHGKPLRHDGEVNVLEDELQQRKLHCLDHGNSKKHNNLVQEMHL